MDLRCALCMFDRDRDAESSEAVTVMNGQAVCLDHLGYVQGGEFAAILRFFQEQGGRL